MEEKNKNLQKNKVNVCIDGTIYTLFTTEDEDYIQGVAKYINNKIKEISSSDKNIANLKKYFYIWLCLNIADDLFKHRQLSLKNKNFFQVDIDKITLNNSNLEKKLKEREAQVNNLEKKLKEREAQVNNLEEKLRENKQKENNLIETYQNNETFNNLKNIIEGLKEENKILTKSFDEFSQNLNFKIENSNNNDELNEIINIYNKTIVNIAQKIGKIRNNTNLN